MLPKDEQDTRVFQYQRANRQTTQETESDLLVDLEDPTPNVGRVGVRLVLHREHLAVLLRALLLRPEGRESLEGNIALYSAVRINVVKGCVSTFPIHHI